MTEVTDAMIEAAFVVAHRWELTDDPYYEHLYARLFRAMAAAQTHPLRKNKRGPARDVPQPPEVG